MDYSWMRSQEQKLDDLLTLVGGLQVTIDELKAKVDAEGTVIDSAITLLAGISQMLKDAGTDQAKLQALGAQIDAKKDELAASVTANTPAAPPTP